MTAETDAAADIDADEGSRLKVYDDATGKPVVPGYTLVGHPSIGIGRALDTNGISLDEQAILLANDMRTVEAGLDREIPWWRQQPSWVQRAMIEIAFQMGVHGEALFIEGLSALRIRDYITARAAFTNSAWARKYPARAGREIALLSDQAPDGIGGTS